ncbi:DUF222 domain-containing protein [Nocardia sp. NPDC059180]|uniref:DUF222 domain-containing protein n=1 Tax=Nocardia sp. NPDC059180 TaxID=3346761 RepID=UPI00369C79E0
MGSSGGIGEGAAARLHAAIADLLDEPLTPLTDDGVIDLMRDVERCTRMLTMVRHRLLVEAGERSLPARHGSKSLKRFLMETLNLAGADAGARVHQAHTVATFHDMAGEPVDPLLPHTAQALTAGDISADHARGIATVMNRVPRGASADDRAAAEDVLTEFARSGSPDDIGKVGDKILAYLDPDGHLTTDHDRARMRGITIGRQRPDGMSPIRGDIDPVLRALLDPLLAKYARPGMCNPDDPASPTISATGLASDTANPATGLATGTPTDLSNCRAAAGPASPFAGNSTPAAAIGSSTAINSTGPATGLRFPAFNAADSGSGADSPAVGAHRGPDTAAATWPEHPAAGPAAIDPAVIAEAAARDHRSPAQRNHDALKALLESGVIADQLGTHRGVPVATILTMSIDDVEHGAGVATTATGGTVPLRDALAMAERSQPWLAVFDHAGLPLHLGRTKRLASRDQRLALIAALKGCSRPGCNAPASLCAVHHVLDYRKNGSTDIENLTLACDACHALIHDGPGGWKTRIEGPRSPYAGRTAWIAPPHIDPQQKPRINHRHHANELLAQALSRIHLRNEHAREQHRGWRREARHGLPQHELSVAGMPAGVSRSGHYEALQRHTYSAHCEYPARPI